MLFADLVSSTEIAVNLETDEAQSLLDHCMATMAEAIRQFGGFVIRYQGDGVMASFGAPQAAEDHALRACFAGLSIQQAFRNDSRLCDADGNALQVRVGIHSGLVITRNLQSDVGEGLDVAGPSVSIAALAEKVCKVGSVTATSVTAELAGDFLSTIALDVTDKSIPGIDFVQVLDASLERNQKNQHLNSMLVGRAAEQSELSRALDDLDNSTSFHAIVGDAGIGKSALVSWVVGEASKRQMPVYTTAAFSLTSASPYMPLRRLLFDLLEIGKDANSQMVLEKVTELGMSGSMQDELVAFLTGRRSSGSRKKVMEGSATNLLSGLLATVIIRILGQTRALVVIEDVHFLDSESLFCLRQIARSDLSNLRTLFVLSARPEAKSQLDRVSARILELSPLDKTAVSEYISSRFDSIAVSDELESEISHRSGGVPLVLEQLVQMVSSPSVRAEFKDLPGKVESLVHARLYLLSASAKEVIQKLSILGDQFELSLATRFLEVSSDQLTQCAEELSGAGFLTVDASNIARFKHSVIRESCQNSLVQKELVPLHALALKTLVDYYQTHPPVYERLAYHAELSKQDESALAYLWEACKQAAQQSAVRSLSILYDRAIACCERIGDHAESVKIDVVLLAFDAMQQHGQIQKVVPKLKHIADVAEKIRRPDKQGLALTHLSTVLWFQAEYQKGRVLAEQAVELANQNKSLPAQFYSRFTLANLLHGCGNTTAAVAELSELASVLTGDLETAHLGAIGLPSVMCRSFLGWYHIELGNIDAAGSYVDAASEIAAQVDKPYTTVIANVPKGRLHLESGATSDACAVLQPLRDLCLKHRIYAMDPIVTGLLASALIDQGDAKTALEITQYSIENSFYKNAARFSWYFLFSSYAAALSHEGRHDDAINSLLRTIAASEKPLDQPNLAKSLVAYGFLLLDNGQEVRAVNAFKRALDIARRCKMRPTLARAHFGLSLCEKQKAEDLNGHREISLDISRKLNIALRSQFLRTV